jgi:hypothetical protein
MSQQQQGRDADRNSPIRRATATRESASGRGDRIASARDVAGYFRDDCRTLHDSLQLEMVVAQYLLRMRGAHTSEGMLVGDAISAGVVAELERHGDPLSHAILRALADLGTGETARRSAEAVARLGERGVGIRARFADVAGARALGAWRHTTGGRRGEFVVFVDFEFPLGARHAIALFVEPRRGGVVKHIGLTGPMSELDSDDPFHPAAGEILEIGEAGALLSEVLDRSFGPGLAATDDYRVLIAAARARSMLKGC